MILLIFSAGGNYTIKKDETLTRKARKGLGRPILALEIGGGILEALGHSLQLMGGGHHGFHGSRQLFSGGRNLLSGRSVFLRYRNDIGDGLHYLTRLVRLAFEGLGDFLDLD